MPKKYLNSLVPLLACPSAMFRGTDTEARLICEVMPKVSCFG